MIAQHLIGNNGPLNQTNHRYWVKPYKRYVTTEEKASNPKNFQSERFSKNVTAQERDMRMKNWTVGSMLYNLAQNT